MPLNAILTLADALTYRRLTETVLPDATAHLPPLDEQTFQDLMQQADLASRLQPRHGWAIMAVTEAAAAHTASPHLQARAAWHLARHYNEYARPLQAREVLIRARTLFQETQEPGWLAACTWQYHALSFANANLPQTIAALQVALTELEAAGPAFASFVPQCRLVLAANQIMEGNLASAEAHLHKCEQAFQNIQDPFYMNRCYLARINIGRRSKPLEEVWQWLDEALKQAADWPAEKAKFMLQQGYIQWLKLGDYAAAIATLIEVIHGFAALDMPVWTAQAQDALAQIYTITGRLVEAETLLQEALRHARDDGAVQLHAAIHLDLGWYHTQRGDPKQALEHLQTVKQSSEQLGNQWMHAAALMHLGDAYEQLGCYQLALQNLEQSYARFQALGGTSRLAECELRLSQIWLGLGQPSVALRHLEQAGDHARQANHPTVWPYLYSHQANSYFHQSEMASALAALEEGLKVAQQQDDPYSTALLQRALSEVWIALDRPDEALPYLEMAQARFQSMDMSLEIAVCQVVWGHYYQRQGHYDQAQEAWEKALALTKDVMPDIAWQAAAGLAVLAQNQHDEEMALRHYHQFREALHQLRYSFWQPELISSFLQRPAAAWDQAVELAVQAGNIQDVLAFVEENKARLNARILQSSASPRHQPNSPELQTMVGQIHWLENQLRASPGSKKFWSGSREERQLRRQLKELRQRYYWEQSQWQRQNQPHLLEYDDVNFSPDAFCSQATAVLGQNWIALDFYLTTAQLQGVVLTPTDRFTWVKKLTANDQRALLDMVRYGWEAWEEGTVSPLYTLGKLLLPEAIASQMTPTTTLIIAPHRQLHDIPWAALLFGEKPLVASCVPVIVPSLSSLMSLCSRPRHSASTHKSGLLLAVSDFPDGHQALPHVVAESEVLRPHLGTFGVALRETEATWEQFLSLGQTEGLDQFSFWHVASHAFHEPNTGRLSGISFYDKDVWLDELWQCAPLPRLVTLSACSGSKGKRYEGDEQIGLAATCLAAGADTVVGSLWPVADKVMPQLMGDFYAALGEGQPVALALASAQRRAWVKGQSWRLWGGFTCTGLPG